MKTTHILLNGKPRTIKEGVNPDEAIERLRAKGYTVEKTKPCPTIATLRKWVSGSVTCKATDGCKVEPDGTCCHGKKSWLLVLGMI
jgi:hypothetical protein